jgi:hypothetical protein
MPINDINEVITIDDIYVDIGSKMSDLTTSGNYVGYGLSLTNVKNVVCGLDLSIGSTFMSSNNSATYLCIKLLDYVMSEPLDCSCRYLYIKNVIYAVKARTSTNQYIQGFYILDKNNNRIAYTSFALGNYIYLNPSTYTTINVKDGILDIQNNKFVSVPIISK